MNKQIIAISSFSVAMTILLSSLVAYGQVGTLDGDQLYICNFEDECIFTSILDVMTEDKAQDFSSLKSTFDYTDDVPNAPIFEDQLVIYNYDLEGYVVNQDDYMNKEQLSNLWNQYKNDIDTFDWNDINCDVLQSRE